MKKIEVKTTCGETFTLEVDTDQEIESMEEVVETQTEDPFDEPQNEEDVKKLIEHLHGGKWKWETNTEPQNMDYFKYVRRLHNASFEGFTVPENPHDLIITPYAFARRGNRIPNYNSLWSRVGATEVKPKRMLEDHF